jgi:membrane protein EpsK
VLKNIIANFTYFISNIIIGIFLVPYYIRSLGIDNYAFIPLATSMILYIGFITQSINSSILRFLSLDLQRNDIKQANRTFNTSLFGLIGIILLLTPAIIGFIYYFPSFFDVSLEMKNEVTLLLVGILITFFIKTVGSVFGVSLFAYNRLDLQKYVELLNLLFRVGLTIIFFTLLSPALKYVGLAYLIGSLVYYIGTLYFSKRVSPMFSIRLNDFVYDDFKDIAKMSGWLLVIQLGTLLFTQAELMLVNKILGSTAGGEYAAVLVWSSMIMNMSGIFAGVFAPVIYAQYAKEQIQKMVSTLVLVIKIMGISMSPMIGCIFVFAPQLLSIWLGTEYENLALLMRIMIIHLILSLSSQPLYAVNAAYNKVKTPGIVTVLLGICNIVLASYLAIYTNMGYYGIAISGALFTTIRNTLFVPWYSCRIMGIDISTLAKPMLYGPITIIPIILLAFIITHIITASNIIEILFICALISILHMIATWLLLLTPSEKNIIKILYKSKFKNIQ